MKTLPNDPDENENESELYLPMEILINILSYLPVRDRKTFRLASTDFYNASLEVPVQNTQKFLIPKDTCTPFVDTFINSNYKSINLEFVQTSIVGSFEIFIKKHGARVHSLCFKKCEICLQDLLGIIAEHCPNLISLSFHRTSFNYDINSLKETSKKFTRKSLSKLALVGCNWATDAIFTLFFKIYPRVKELKLYSVPMAADKRILNRFYKKDADSVEPSDYIFSFNCFYEIVKSIADTLKCLHIISCFKTTDYSHLELESFNLINNLRLTELCLDNPRSFVNYYSFLSAQSSLEYIYLSEIIFDKNFVEFLFNNFPKLRRVKLEHTAICYPDEKFLRTLVKSKLQEFGFKSRGMFGFNNRDNLSITDLGEFINNDLQSLSFECSSFEQSGMEFLVTKFQNLTYLELSHCHWGMRDSVLKVLISNQKKLHTLKLISCSMLTDCGFENPKLESTVLRELHLVGLGISEKTINNLIIPNLEHLNLTDCLKINDVGFSNLHTQLPLLRKLQLKCTKITKETLLKICLGLPRLYHVKAPGIDTNSLCAEHLEKLCAEINDERVNVRENERSDSTCIPCPCPLPSM